jgi:hypothetical protein
VLRDLTFERGQQRRELLDGMLGIRVNQYEPWRNSECVLVFTVFAFMSRS